MRSQNIKAIRKKFHREWLLIAVDKMDEQRTIPLTGKLLAHSPHRDEIYRNEMKYQGNTLTVYSEEGIPEGYGAAFYHSNV